MSIIYGQSAVEWIEENHPENGWFRAYWTEDGHGITLDPEGGRLRYGWKYKNGKRADGVSKSFHFKSRSLKHIFGWEDGVYHGRFESYFPDGIKDIEGQHYKGIEVGLWASYYRNGQMWTLGSMIPYEKGILLKRGPKNDGLWKKWDPDGKKLEEIYYEDLYEVRRTEWSYYDNGQMEYEVNYVGIDRKEDGEWTYWYKNGEKEIEGSYKDGVPTGIWTFWKDGVIVGRKDL
jgi:antitoxin component YwqK of YwqJK toxin-antitoxin module